MIDAHEILQHISVIMVFLEGILSFLSPCVLPMLPIYMGYLAGSSSIEGKKRSKNWVLFFTICFIFGIFTALFLMNLSIGIISSFFKEHMAIFTRVGGVLIILLGLFQFGFFKSNTLEKTKRFHLPMQKNMNFLFAFLMGFTFSFAWTPCVGPALSSILLLANSAQDFWMSNMLMVVYALGLTIPFLLVGIFTEKILDWLSKHKNIMKYTVKIGAAILILFGIMMFTGKMNSISNYMTPESKSVDVKKQESGKNDKDGKENVVDKESKSSQNKGDKNGNDGSEKRKQSNEEKEAIRQLVNYSLLDQKGNEVKIKDYKGKVIFLNFWATWCPPCKNELPHIQKLYDKYKDDENVAVLTIVYPGGKEKDVTGIKKFLDDNKYTIPVLFDDGFFYSSFGITSMPTTFMLDKEGKPFGYIQGALTSDMMESMITKTLQNS